MSARHPLPLQIDSTMLTCARSCLQKFDNEFIKGFRPPGLSIDLHAGACFATGVETVYRCIFEHQMSLPESLDRARAAFFLAWGDFEIPEWKRTAKTADRTWEAVEEYFVKWPPITDIVVPLMNAAGKPTLEYTFAIPLEPFDTDDHGRTPVFPAHPSGAPFLYTGRYDMLAQTPEGRVMPKDDKTTGSSIGQDWARKWHLRSQFIGYVWALRQLGYDCDSVHVRGIAIQKTQFSFAEATVHYSDFLIDEWHETLRRDLWRIVHAYEEGRFDKNLGDACTTYGLCPFMDACMSKTPEAWLANMEVRHWNPLEKNPAKVTDPSQERAVA